jgi:tripartite-type tricarboxylate transporter receptor subunit TctC
MKLTHRRQFLRLAAGATALPLAPDVARAQAYPTRPITIVVPVPPGGPTDTIARIVAERMRVSLGQPVVIENSAGAAGGSVGIGRVARAAPDGYTMAIGHWQTFVANGAIYSLPYDLVEDFVPIGLIADAPNLILSSNAVPAQSLSELLAWLRANPDKVLTGSTGAGSPAHVASLQLQKITNGRFQFVPYRGAGPAIQALLSGEINLYLTNATVALPQVRAGKIRAYAVSSRTRMNVAPEIPSVDEAGLPGMYFSLWHAFWAPKGTPGHIVERLNASVVDALADPGIRGRLGDLGNEVFPRDMQTPRALAALQKAEISKWWPIIKEAGIKPEG